MGHWVTETLKDDTERKRRALAVRYASVCFQIAQKVLRLLNKCLLSFVLSFCCISWSRSTVHTLNEGIFKDPLYSLWSISLAFFECLCYSLEVALGGHLTLFSHLCLNYKKINYFRDIKKKIKMCIINCTMDFCKFLCLT